MTNPIAKSFQYQLESLADYICTNYCCTSPESCFARYIFYGTSISPPSCMVESSKVIRSTSARLHEAPILSVAGYELACTKGIDEDSVERWVNSLSRLAKCNPFPSDRMSFFYRPVELFGIALGINYCSEYASDNLCWLRKVLTAGEDKLLNSDLCSVLLSSYAAYKLSVVWKFKGLPPIEDLNIEELALIKWICCADSLLARTLGFDIHESKIDISLLKQSITTSLYPSDVCRAALLYFSIKVTVNQVIEIECDNSWLNNYTGGEIIGAIKFLCNRFHLASQHLQRAQNDVEFHNSYDGEELLNALSQLDSDLCTTEQIVKKALYKTHKSVIYNQEIRFTGENLNVTNNHNSFDVQQNFNSPVYGVAGKVEGDQNIFVSEQKQTLAEAAQEIQQLLKQLEASNPTASDAQKENFLNVALSPSRKQRILGALGAGWKEIIKEVADSPYINIIIAMLEGWQNVK